MKTTIAHLIGELVELAEAAEASGTPAAFQWSTRARRCIEIAKQLEAAAPDAARPDGAPSSFFGNLLAGLVEVLVERQALERELAEVRVAEELARAIYARNAGLLGFGPREAWEHARAFLRYMPGTANPVDPFLGTVEDDGEDAAPVESSPSTPEADGRETPAVAEGAAA